MIPQSIVSFLRASKDLPFRCMAFFNFLLEATLSGRLLIMTKFLLFATGALFGGVDRAAILNEIRDSFAAFTLIPANAALPQAKDLSAYSGDPNTRQTYYTFNNIVGVYISDDLKTGATTFSLSVAMADFPDSMDVHDLFALFLIDCSTRLPNIRFEARAIVDELYNTMVPGEGSSKATLQRGDYLYSLWMSHTDSGIFFDVEILK